MATNRIPALQFSPQPLPNVRPSPKQLPETFQQALATGWSIVSEGTALSIDQKTRRGRVILASKDKSQRISVSYAATKAGFVFGVPQLTQ